jgi:hypothetical protein
MMQEDLRLLNKLHETFPNSKGILSFYLNIMLVLEGARLSYRVDINPPKSKTRYDFINVALDIYPDTFEIFKNKAPFIFLKSNKQFINSTLEKMTHENIGIVLGYCYSNSDGLDVKLMRIGLSIMANQINHKTQTQLYAICVPANILNETIMNAISNEIINYNKILNKYGYCVSLRTDILWLRNDNIIRNCIPSKYTLK